MILIPDTRKCWRPRNATLLISKDQTKLAADQNQRALFPSFPVSGHFTRGLRKDACGLYPFTKSAATWVHRPHFSLLGSFRSLVATVSVSVPLAVTHGKLSGGRGSPGQRDEIDINPAGQLGHENLNSFTVLLPSSDHGSLNGFFRVFFI